MSSKKRDVDGGGSNQRPDARIFISIDMDAFYCGVEEVRDPSLIDEPFAVIQKNVVASLSYPARALGLRKLMSATELRQQYPQVRSVNGESLAPYRETGWDLFRWMHELTDYNAVERLGLEEMKLEITSQVEAIVEQLTERQVFGAEEVPDHGGGGATLDFYSTTLDCDDFFFEFPGKTWPAGRNGFLDCPEQISPQYYVAGHIAQGIADRMLLEKGFKCSVGVASSKTLAKIACGFNKPNGVTVVLPGYEQEFISQCALRQVPGFGSRTRANLIGRFALPADPTVKDLHSCVKREEFLQVGSPYLWDLTLGNEDADIVPYNLPSQVSVEDTFFPFVPISKTRMHIERLVGSLLGQIQTDMISGEAWLATPSHFRLSICREYTPRKSKTTKLALVEKILPMQLEDLTKTMLNQAHSMLLELSTDHVRLINVAVMFSPLET